MKKALLTVLEPTTATLLVAFGIGLGIAVHPVFFLAALLIAIAALFESILNAAGRLSHRHP
jgi:ABC-type antimicrobial peptide transport system permease subunit